MPAAISSAPSLWRARRRRRTGALTGTAAAAGLLLVALLSAATAAAAADTTTPSSCGHSLPAVRAMTRAEASRLRIQRSREYGTGGSEAGAADAEQARQRRLRVALAAAPKSGAPLRVAVLSRLSSSSPDESDALDAFADDPQARAAAVDYAERVLVPGALAALRRHLRLRLPAAAGRPIVPCDGPGALPAGASCGAARGAGAEISGRGDLMRGEADLALFVTAATGGGDDGSLCPPGAVAWAVPCARDAALTGRPTAAAVNLCPRVLQQGPEGLPVERAVAAVVHELVHVLGFQDELFDGYFSAETGEPHARLDGGGGVVISVGGRPYLTTPRAAAAARAHFGCASLPGAPLEDEGGEGSALSHWEATALNHELMAPATPEDGALQRLSPLTLAALADSGWWVVAGDDDDDGDNQGKGGPAPLSLGAPMEWGRGAGCDFVTQPCADWARDRGASQPYFCPGLPTPGYADGQLLVAAGLVPASAAPPAASRAACTPDGRALATCGDSPGPGRFTNGCVMAASSAAWPGGARLSCSSGGGGGGVSGGEGGVGVGSGSGYGQKDDDEWWSARELRVFAAMGGGAGGSGKYCATPLSDDAADRICPTAAAAAQQQQQQKGRRAGGWAAAVTAAALGESAPGLGPTCSSEAAMGTYWCVSAQCVRTDDGKEAGVALDVALRDGSRRSVPCERAAGGEGVGGAGAPLPPLAPWERGVADLARHLRQAYRSGRVTCPPAAVVCAQKQQQQAGDGAASSSSSSSCTPGCAPPFGECVGGGDAGAGACRCLRLDAAGPDCRGSVVPDPPAPYYRRLRPYGG